MILSKMQIKDTYVNWYAKPLPSSTAHSFFYYILIVLKEQKRNLLLYLTQTLYHFCVYKQLLRGEGQISFHQTCIDVSSSDELGD